MEADDRAAACEIHRLECRVEELKNEIHRLECRNEELENENDSLRDELFHSNNRICDLVEREAYRDDLALRRG